MKKIKKKIKKYHIKAKNKNGECAGTRERLKKDIQKVRARTHTHTFMYKNLCLFLTCWIFREGDGKGRTCQARANAIPS